MTQDADAYREAFVREARENLERMNAALLEAERSPGSLEPLREAIRAVHTLKGMAGMMRLEGVATLCHALEDALEAARRGELDVAAGADPLFEAFDRLADAVAAVERGAPEPELGPAVSALRAAVAGEPAPAPGPPAEQPIRPGRLEQLPVKVERLDRLMNLVEELLVAKMRFDPLRAALASPELSAAVDSLGRLVAELQYQVLRARMVPIGLVVGRFQRMVRDLAREQGKEVRLLQEGGDVELDRAMHDELAEALVHLLRNAIDHGIEKPAERVRRGKPPAGTIRVEAERSKDSAALIISDDGEGLDLEAIRRAGESRGLLQPGAGVTEVLAALLSGLSTRPRATAVSGRGLGLEIAASRLRDIGGSLSASSERGKATTFRLEVPLTLAILRSLLVEAGGGTYGLPLNSVARIVSVPESRVRRVLGREAVVIGAREVPLLRLGRLLRRPAAGPDRFPVVVLAAGERRLGLAVDALVSTQELVLKPLSRVLRESGPFAGSAIIGAGEAILVLDVAELLRAPGTLEAAACP